jgi:hypothetical protein
MADGTEEVDTESGMSWEEMFGGLAGSTSTGVFSPDFRYVRREINGLNPNLTSAQQQQIGAKMQQVEIPNGRKTFYEGEYLVDSQGYITRAPYDPRKDAYNVLFGEIGDTSQRALFLDLLASRGYYGTGKPSATGTLSKDRTAVAEFLVAANAAGYTWDSYVSQVASQPGGGVRGGGARYRVSEPEDIEAYLRQASLERLGRTMTRADVDKAIAAIQGEQAAGAAPSLGVAAEQQVRQLEPERERAYRFARAIDIAMGQLGT